MSQKNCHYCGIKPNLVVKNGIGNNIDLINGLDRINSKKGYTVDNTVTCCSQCNYAKREMDINQFINFIKRIVKYQSEKA